MRRQSLHRVEPAICKGLRGITAELAQTLIILKPVEPCGARGRMVRHEFTRAPRARSAGGGRKREPRHENRDGHHQAVQTRRGARRPDRGRRPGPDRDRGQGLRPPEGSHRNLPRHRVRRELPAEAQDRGRRRRAIRSTRSSTRSPRPPRPARSATARSSSSRSTTPCASAPARPTPTRSRNTADCMLPIRFAFERCLIVVFWAASQIANAQ